MLAQFSNFDGEAAALATAVLWSFSALAWSLAGRKVGSVPVCSLRILLAAILLGAMHRIAYGSVLPSLPAETMWMLVASGVLGAGLADLCYFRALVLVGPRLGTLLLVLVPIFTSLAGYLLPPHERPGALALVGIAMIVGGVVAVFSEKRSSHAWPATPAARRQGVLAALACVVLTSFGYLTSRLGMMARPSLFGGEPLAAVEHPLSGAVVRVVAATVTIWALLPLMRSVGPTLAVVRRPRIMAIIVVGTIVGPVIGITLSMAAFAGAQAGIASALISTSPIIMIPIAYFAYGDKPTLRTLAGTAAAVGGIFLLMTR